MILLRQNQSNGKLRHLFLLGETRGIIFAFCFSVKWNLHSNVAKVSSQ